MLTYPHIDPIALSLGPLKIHWYGLMYLLGFGSAYLLALWRAKRIGWTNDQVADLIFYCAMGVIIGGRLGYVFFYGFDRFINDPLWAIRLWEGGMSFHGGFLGVLVAGFLFARRYNTPWLEITDLLAVIVPPGLMFGRIGNFIGGELWGRPVSNPELPWGMVFPHVDALARHPSQLYEALFEGLVLFLVIFIFTLKPRPRMAASSLFLIGYGLARFNIEFFREPDVDQGFVLFNWMTKGQMLTAPMIILGVVLLIISYRKSNVARVAEQTRAALAKRS